MTATKRRAKVRGRRSGADRRKDAGRTAERSAAPKSGQRSGAARRKGGEVRNQRFANPSLPRLWRGPARHARVTARPAKRRREKRRPDGHAKRRAERREANDCGQRSEAARRKDAKSEDAQLQILPCRPQPGTAQRAIRASLRGQRSSAAHRKISKVCNQRFANPSLSSPVGTAQRAVRASQAWPCEVPPRKARAGRPSEAPRRKA